MAKKSDVVKRYSKTNMPVEKNTKNVIDKLMTKGEDNKGPTSIKNSLLPNNSMINTGAINVKKSTGASNIVNNVSNTSGLGKGGFFNNTNKKTNQNMNTSIKVKDYLPHGEKSNMWNGIMVGGIPSLGGITGGLLGGKSGLGNLSKKLTGALGGMSQNIPGMNVGSNNRVRSDSFFDSIGSLSKEQKNFLNSPQVNSLRLDNNKNFINDNLSHIGGLTPEGLDKVKNITVGGMTLDSTQSKIYESLGVSSYNYFLNNTPVADKVEMSWGQAFKDTMRDPQFLSSAAVTLLGGFPRLEEKVYGLIGRGSDTIDEFEKKSGITAEDVLNVSSDTEAYVLGLRALYNNMSQDQRDLLSAYKYYKINMNYYNDPNVNVNGTGYNLGHELSDSFFGSVNYNVTSFLDGASDYISETWQNISYDAADWVKNQMEGFKDFSKSLENATGIRLEIPAAWEDKIYDSMEKLGFGNPGIGTDTKAYIITTLLQKTYVVIKSKNQKVNVDASNVMFYYERYEYRSKLTAERRVRVKLTNGQLAMLDLQDEKLTISIKRRYGFSLGQSPEGTYPAEFNTEMTDIERDAIYDWPAKVVNNDTKGSKEDQTKTTTKKEGSGEDTFDPRVLMQLQEVEFILTPPLLIGNHTDETFNGILEGENTISEILDSAFRTAYDEGTLCMAIPKNNFALKDVAIPPMNFEGMLQNFQKEYDIYDGGPVLFHDHLVVKGVEEDVYFLLPKRGVVDMKFDEGWEVELRVRHVQTPDAPDMLCYIIPSRKKIIWPITERDIKKPGDSAEFGNDSVVRYSKGSIMGAQQPGAKKAINKEVIQTNTEYATPQRQDTEIYDHIYVKIPNAFFTFTPGDMVTIKWRDVTYKANVKEWASQYAGGVRIVLLVLISEVDKTKKTWLDKLSPGNWIEKMQQSVAAANAKFTNTMNDWSEKSGNWLQTQFVNFSKWEDEHLTFKGMNILEWLNMVDPSIPVPKFDQAANQALTDAEYVRDLYGIEMDDAFSSGQMHGNATHGSDGLFQGDNSDVVDAIPENNTSSSNWNNTPLWRIENWNGNFKL